MELVSEAIWTKFAMNPKLRNLVRTRNRLRKKINSANREEWLETSGEVRKAREEAKLEAWSEFVESLEDRGLS